jgi:hypothetical protein
MPRRSPNEGRDIVAMVEGLPIITGGADYKGRSK